MILAGDIGGTKTVLALFDDRTAPPRIIWRNRFTSAEFGGIEELLRRFMRDCRQPVEGVCLGVAGPVVDGRCRTTNLPWTVDSGGIAASLDVASVELINDIEAMTYGVAMIRDGALQTIGDGSPEAGGSVAVIAAGTGLGEGAACWDGGRHVPVSGEGGHTDFAPRNDIEIELLRYLLGKYPRVGWERILSGPGLVNIYHFLRDSGRGREPDWLAREMADGDAPAVITRAALKRGDPLSTDALRLFVSLYGAEAGNLALKIKATGGVYVGGGIAPRIVESLCDGTFMAAFLDKDRMRPLMEKIRVRVVLDTDCALLGAFNCAWLKKTGGRLVLNPRRG